MDNIQELVDVIRTRGLSVVIDASPGFILCSIFEPPNSQGAEMRTGSGEGRTIYSAVKKAWADVPEDKKRTIGKAKKKRTRR